VNLIYWMFVGIGTAYALALAVVVVAWWLSPGRRRS
jgi:hypothetical protein